MISIKKIFLAVLLSFCLIFTNLTYSYADVEDNNISYNDELIVEKSINTSSTKINEEKGEKFETKDNSLIKKVIVSSVIVAVLVGIYAFSMNKNDNNTGM